MVLDWWRVCPLQQEPGLAIPQAKMFEDLFDHLFIFYETMKLIIRILP
jgi:hypothetical protein